MVKSKRKIFTRVFSTLVSIALLSVAGLLIYGLIYGDDIKHFVLSELNKKLAVEIEVSDIHFSLLENFPHASVSFTDVRSLEKTAKTQQKLIEASEVTLLFNTRNLIAGNYIIDRIKVDRAFINLVVDANGKTNFYILKENQTQQEKSFRIELKNMAFKGVEISFMHQPAQQEYLINIEQGKLKGLFDGATNHLFFNGQVYSSYIKTGETTLLHNRLLGLDLELQTYDNFEHININKGQVEMEELVLSINGLVNTNTHKRHLDLNLTTEETTLSNLFTLIPEQYLAPVKPYQTEGMVKLSAKISGSFAGNHLPALQVAFNISKGKLTYPETNVTLDDIQLAGTFNNNGANHAQSYVLSVNDFASVYKKSKITGQFSVINFKNPEVDVHVKSSLDLNDLKTLIAIDTLESISGSMSMDLMFKNRLKNFREFTIHDFITSHTSGNLTLSNAYFKVKGSPLLFSNFNGSFSFNNKDLVIENFTGEVSDNDFTMAGHFGNILGWAFLPDESLYIQADVQSNHIDLDKLLKDPENRNDNSVLLSFSGNIGYNIDLSINNFHFRKFDAKNLSGNLYQTNKIIHLRNGKLTAMEGEVDISGSINGTNSDKYSVLCNARTNNVNIRELFRQFGNFHQTNIVADQLNGYITCETEYSSILYPNLTVDLPSVKVLSDIQISNGELIEYAPLYELSGFIDKAELKHIRFTELSNRIEILNEVVYIPHMLIESSSIDLVLSGSHSFDNVIDYHVNLALAEVIKRKPKKENEDIGNNFIREETSGQPRLFLALTGNALDPDIKYDSRAVRDKISSDLAGESIELKELLKKEFSRNKKVPKTLPSGDHVIETPEPEKDFKLSWDEMKKDSIPEKQGHKDFNARDHSSKNMNNKKKEFIISWDEKKDSIK